MTRQAAGTIWPSAYPPAAEPLVVWHLHDVAELPGVRAQVRARIGGAGLDDLLDQLVLALDEMASNALRHGGGQVRAALHTTGDGYLLEVTDQAARTPPTPAVGRDPSLGGLGLYLIAELAAEHGWYAEAGAKHVWALLRR
ncbi:ATP-binding protein [Blastococcus sp. BMG 814]|uniref:ATP-binding protein n=1 Tax=Blastococcus carthaginiensis TaxID=3050034 RepID=A0ABT9IJG4_9ACTN|nr:MULTISPECIES: ATP-binding protein [Blastococcus]MDP5185382.1 ATP-binding protein [Blastococcus carthaginiensis]SEL96745.1 Anti-sigma regulatory factor (Ser/Thr protein kinase) [Blastococcus sp. DSM 46786]